MCYQKTGVWWDRVHLTRQPPFGLLYLPRIMDDDEFGLVGGMTGRVHPNPIYSHSYHVMVYIQLFHNFSVVVESSTCSSLSLQKLPLGPIMNQFRPPHIFVTYFGHIFLVFVLNTYYIFQFSIFH
jgi:hypothetical protein